jgi:hypothetical protein
MGVYSRMANRTVVKHYTKACDLQACLTIGSQARAFFRGTQTTNTGSTFIDGTVSALSQRSDGGYDLSFTYPETTIPPGFVVLFPTSANPGNTVDPICLSEGSWMWAVNKMISTINQSSLISYRYGLINSATHLSNSTYYVPRVVFATGFHLTSVKLSCHKYDIGTSATFTMRYRTTANAAVPDSSLPVCATFTGTLSAQRAMTVTVPVIPYDAELVLVISGTTTSIYANSTLGLTLDTVGFIVP